MELNSCLYECSVMHHRLAPKVHHFRHDLFMFWLDLDELDSAARRIFFLSHNRANLYAFRDDDHLPSGASALKTRLIDWLAQNGVQFDPRGRICLLTLPRVLGYVFNPISVYFGFDPSGAPVCAVAEVGNTFGEMKLYLLGPDDFGDDHVFSRITVKNFYVSPFSALDLKFEFKLGVPGEALALFVDDWDGAEKTLITSLTGRRAPLTNRRLLWLTIKCPLVTLKVISLIHWHALLLWMKRVPFHRKAANPTLQTDVLRPHSASLGTPK